MARPRNGTSPHTHYRRACERVATLEQLLEKLDRTRPRTRGKRAAKTRGLNRLKRQLAAAGGMLTKARNAIASGASRRASSAKEASRKRSESAKKGWATRRARAAESAVTEGRHDAAIPMLTPHNVVYVWPPSKADRTLISEHWHAIELLLSTGSREALAPFAARTIYDEISGKRLRFATDPAFIVARSDEFSFGLTFYRDRREVSRFAA